MVSSNNQLNTSLPYSETYDTFIKTKEVFLRTKTFQGSKHPYETCLLKYFLVVFQPKSLNLLPSLINKHISYNLYYRYIQDFDDHYGFLLVTIKIDVLNCKEVDLIAKKLEQMGEELIKRAKGINLTLVPLKWKHFEKIKYNKKLWMKNLPINVHAIEGTAESVLTKDSNILDIFTITGKMRFVHRPNTASPPLKHNIILGTNFHNDNPIGINSNQLLIYGNDFNKNHNILLKFFGQLFVPDEDKNRLTLIYNFTDISFKFPYSTPYPVHSYSIADLNLDPLIVAQKHPFLHSRLIKALTHILQLLPTQIASFEGIMTKYLQQKSHSSSLMSLPGFIEYLTKLATNTNTSEESFKEISKEPNKSDEVSFSDSFGLETMTVLGANLSSNNTDRTIGTINKKTIYLESLIANDQNTQEHITSLAEKKSIILIDQPHTPAETKLLAFFLLTEIFNKIDNDFQLVVLGFDYFLDSIPMISRETYYWFYSFLGLRSTAILTLLTNKPDFSSYFRQLGNRYNRLHTAVTSHYDFSDETVSYLRENLDLAVLDRYDYPNELFVKLEGDFPIINEPNFFDPLKSLLEFLFLEPLSSVMAYEYLQFIASRDHHLNFPECLAVEKSEYYFDGLEAIEELSKKGYVSRQSRLHSSIELTPEANLLLRSLPAYFKQFKPTTLIDLQKIYPLSKQIEIDNKFFLGFGGIISDYLPKLNWHYIFSYFQLAYKIAPTKDILKNLYDLNDKIKQK